MKISLLTLTLCLPLFASAATPLLTDRKPDKGGAVSIYYENDMFGGTDRYYTSGARIAYTTGDLNEFSDSAFAANFNPLLAQFGIINRPKYQRNFALTLGQDIYTPDNTETDQLVENERPYAGWLYLGLGVVWKNEKVRNSAVLQIGIVGPASFAEESQRAVHEARGLGVPQGWQNQLHNELGVNFNFEQTRRWFRRDSDNAGFGFDALPHWGFAVGNVHTHVNVGGELRFGWNLPNDFGTAPISAATTTSTPLRDGTPQVDGSVDDSGGFGAYFFVRADGRAVLRNIFLDGNTFQDSHSVDKKWFVADLSAGLCTNYNNTKITYSLVYRTKEYDGQEEGQLFGSIALNFAF